MDLAILLRRRARRHAVPLKRDGTRPIQRSLGSLVQALTPPRFQSRMEGVASVKSGRLFCASTLK